MKKLAILPLIAVIISICVSPRVSAIEINTKEILRAHNQWRAEVGVSPLAYSTELAQGYASIARRAIG